METLRISQYIICCMLLFTLISVSDTVQAEGEAYSVGTSSLNVRTTPSHSGEVVGKLNPGDTVIAFKESHGWIQTYYNGQEVWVASQYLYAKGAQEDRSDPQPQETASDKSNITVSTNNVRIRSGPGTNNQIIGSANNGDSYQLVSTEGDWHKVVLNNGSAGWIAASLTTEKVAPPVKEASTKNEEPAEIKVLAEKVNTSSGKSLSGLNFVLDPGHGGNDPGTIGLNGLHEKDITLSTAHKVAQKLRDNGATVILTRTNDRYLSLENRVGISNAYYTHAFISLHYDSYPVRSINGFSTHYQTHFGSDRELAREIQSSLSQHIPLNNRGVMQSNYHVLRENRDLAVLIELGFLTNSTDLSIVQKDDYQNSVSEGITNGLLNYFHK